MSAKNQLIVFWWSIIFTAIFGIAWFLICGFFPPPAPGLSAAEVVRIYTEHNLAIRIGVAVCLVTGAFLLPWSLVVSLQMERIENGQPEFVWSKIQRLGGALGVMLFLLPPVAWGTAAFTPDRPAEITKAISEFAFLIQWTPAAIFLFQQISFGVVVLVPRKDVHNPFPRWLGWFTMWMAITLCVAVLGQLFKTGPFAWNGLFIAWIPTALFGIWYAVISTIIIKSLKQQAAEQSAALVSANVGEPA